MNIQILTNCGPAPTGPLGETVPASPIPWQGRLSKPSGWRNIATEMNIRTHPNSEPAPTGRF